MKSAALVIIGDEILTGKVKDENSFVFTQTMFERGVSVQRIEVIPDNIEDIGETVRKLSSGVDYLCTSGGIGPTHDDKTFAGIAYGLSLPIEDNEEAINYFMSEQRRAGRGETLSVAQKKMLRYPTPCHVHFLKPMWLPLVIVNNVHIFPGVPALFARMMHGFCGLFTGGQFFREEVFTDRMESEIAFALEDIQERNPDVSIGSYPSLPQINYAVMVTVLGSSKEIVHNVTKEIIALIEGRRSPL